MGLGTYTRGEVHLSLFKSYANKYLQKGLGLIPTWRPMVFLGRFKENLHFLICYSKLKNKLIEVCTKRCMYKKVYNEVPNFMYRNGTYTYVEAHVLFYKTWLF